MTITDAKQSKSKTIADAKQPKATADAKKPTAITVAPAIQTSKVRARRSARIAKMNEGANESR